MEFPDALPFADVFHEGDVADGLGLVPDEGDDGRGLFVIGCPIGVLVSIVEIGGQVKP